MKTGRLFFTLWIFTCFVIGGFAALKDAESGSQPEDLARYAIESIYTGNDFRIVQFKLGVLSHFSYLVESDGKALLIDPGRDISTYLAFARENGLEWAGTFLTHVHADFVAGHREMSHATGSPVYAGHLSGNLFPHVAVRDGDLIEVGKARLRIIETPGHTPDGLCALVFAAALPDRGQYLLSGDTLLVGSFARPDLLGGGYSAAELAGMLFSSWNDKLSRLKDNLVVLPAHGGGPFFGIDLREEASTTIGKEKEFNPYVKFAHDRSAFVTAIISGLSDTPAYFAENAALNRQGPPLVDWNSPLGQRFDRFDGLTMNPSVYIVDVRNVKAYAAGHIRGSINISLDTRLETWVGMLVPFKTKLILRGNETEVLQASKRLQRVGYNPDYFAFDLQFADVVMPVVTPAELHEMMKNGQAPIVVDVRFPKEWMSARIGEVINLPLNSIEGRAATCLNPADTIVTVCDTAIRSGMAVGLFERAGFSGVGNLQGGQKEWEQASLPLLQVGAGLNRVRRDFIDLGLPEVIGVERLKQMIESEPDTFTVIDIRPAEQVMQFNPLEAKAVTIDELLADDEFRTEGKPLLIIDRDGSLSFLAAGMLANRSARRLLVLRGGLEAWWRFSETGLFHQPKSPKKETRPAQEPDESPKSRPAKRKNTGC